MSKQSEAKDRQGYEQKAIPQTCVNCAHFIQRFYHYDDNYQRVEGKPPGTYKYDKTTYSDNLRCGIGGFAARKMGTCNEFAMKA